MRFESDDEETETLDVFYKLAMLTADRASGVLGIRSSTFKKRLRSVGILRWPHRRFKGVADSYSYVAHVLSSTLNSFELGMKSLEKYGTTTCSTSIFRNFRQLDVAVQELQRDLNDLEDYAYELERSFLHTGQVETVVLTPAIRKLLGKLYKHRSSISKYTRRVVRGCCK